MKTQWITFNSLRSGALALSLSLLGSCGGLLDAVSDSEHSYLSSALAIVTQSLNLSEGVPAFIRGTPFIPFAENFRTFVDNNCSVGQGLSTSTCVSKQRSYIYSDCTGTSTGATYSGSLSLTYSNSSCSNSLSNGETLNISTTNYKSTSPDTSVVEWFSSANQNYLSQSYSGGYGMEGDSPSLYKLNVFGINRKKSSA